MGIKRMKVTQQKLKKEDKKHEIQEAATRGPQYTGWRLSLSSSLVEWPISLGQSVKQKTPSTTQEVVRAMNLQCEKKRA